MPNWTYLVVSALYHAGLAIWIGGIVVLGALTAPALFRRLDRAVAGEIFGGILHRFAVLRLAAIVMAIAAAAAKYLAWETHAISAGHATWIAIRWIALALMAAVAGYELAVLEPATERRRVLIRADGEAGDPARLEFNRLHRRAEAIMKASLLAAMVALLFS
ncbi:MAG TPA: DUF4149 domain-containing protein [Thermoanaerobaculia bacterium]|nr:DUF4149 domain-containing protein [Thermoanaerobaculia bacterium]